MTNRHGRGDPCLEYTGETMGIRLDRITVRPSRHRERAGPIAVAREQVSACGTPRRDDALWLPIVSMRYQPEKPPQWQTVGGRYSPSYPPAPGPVATQQVPSTLANTTLGPFLQARRRQPYPEPKKGPILVALGAVLVITLLAITIGTVQHHNSKHHGRATATSASRVADTVGSITVPAVTPGWQGVLSREQQVAYDVPPGWTVQTPGTFSGYQDASGKLTTTMHAVTIYKQHVCPQNQGIDRGMVGFMPIGPSDPRQAAVEDGKLWAQNAAVDSSDSVSGPASAVKVIASPAHSVSLDRGAIKAWQAVTSAPVHPGACLPPRVQVTTVAFANRGNTVLFVAVMDEGVADAAPAGDITAIIASLRPR
ncbi:hypothetical protein ABIA39_004882 [Nocardia sp. GAS34]|jgi:hypothetical protein